MLHLYRRHEPEKTALYPIIEQHLSTLTDELTRHHAALPAFVVDEFRNYLRCGRFEHGFIRVTCDGCRHEHLIAFSCKRRGRAGLTCASRARTGIVTLIQRFGSALNMNVHLHMIILDGVYTLDSNWPRRVFDTDLSVCQLCGGTLRVIAGGRHRTSPIRM